MHRRVADVDPMNSAFPVGHRRPSLFRLGLRDGVKLFPPTPLCNRVVETKPACLAESKQHQTSTLRLVETMLNYCLAHIVPSATYTAMRRTLGPEHNDDEKLGRWKQGDRCLVSECIPSRSTQVQVGDRPHKSAIRWAVRLSLVSRVTERQLPEYTAGLSEPSFWVPASFDRLE